MSANRPTAVIVPNESTSDPSGVQQSALSARQINVARAAAAIVLGVAFLVAIGDDAPTAASVLPAAAAGIVTAYPLIDVVSSILSIPTAGAGARALRGNAAISAVAAVAVGLAAFGSDAGATLLASSKRRFSNGGETNSRTKPVFGSSNLWRSALRMMRARARSPGCWMRWDRPEPSALAMRAASAIVGDVSARSILESMARLTPDRSARS